MVFSLPTIGSIGSRYGACGWLGGEGGEQTNQRRGAGLKGADPQEIQ